MKQKELELELRSNAYYILLALCDVYLHEEDSYLHGYGIRTKTKELSHQALVLPTASIYQNLHRFMEAGVVAMIERDGQKLYTITPQGLDFAKKEKDRLEKLYMDAMTVLEK